MNKRIAKYGLIILLVFSVGLFVANRYVDFKLEMGRYHNFLLIIIVIGILTTVIYYFLKSKITYYVGLFFVVISLLINASFSVDLFQTYAREEQMKKVDAIADCDEAEELFKTDLAEKKLKYFTFGIGQNLEYEIMLRDKYNLKVIHMGCLVRGELICYNEKVEEYLNMRK